MPIDLTDPLSMLNNPQSSYQSLLPSFSGPQYNYIGSQVPLAGPQPQLNYGSWGTPVVQPNMPAPGVPFVGGGMNSTEPWQYAMGGGGYGGMGGYGGSGNLGAAAGMATAERTQALKNLEGRAADYWKTPLASAAQSNLLSIMGGEGPYSQDVQNRMFAKSADQIAAAQDAARQRAYARAGAAGMGTAGSMQNRLANIEGQGALQRQGALSGIQNQAALGNFAARQQGISQANQALGTGYGVTNPLVQQAASARFNTEWGSGIGSDLGTATTNAVAPRKGSGGFLAQAQAKANSGYRYGM